jgi:hypothetical protein
LRIGVLGVVAVTFLMGFTFLLGLLDPYSAYGRMITGLFKPLYVGGNNLLEQLFNHFNNYTFYRMEIIVHAGFVLIISLITFFSIGLLAWLYGRTWCNTGCPVGTILGFLSIGLMMMSISL